MVTGIDAARIAVTPDYGRHDREQAVQAIQDTEILEELVADRSLEDWVRRDAISQLERLRAVYVLNAIVGAGWQDQWVRLKAIDSLGNLFDRENLQAIAQAQKYHPELRNRARSYL